MHVDQWIYYTHVSKAARFAHFYDFTSLAHKWLRPGAPFTNMG